MLEVDGLVAGYGRTRILDGVSFSVSAGEVLGLVGHNGMGKTTVLRTLVGHLPARAGRIRLAGRDIARATPAIRARCGLGYVPQGRQIFPDLTVMDNLRVGEAAQPSPSEIPEVLERFSSLKPLLTRPGRALSGGEQQLLALARCLLSRPAVLLLDEPSEGVQPSIVDRIAGLLQELSLQQGLAIVLVEQDLRLVARIAQRVLVMRRGRITMELAAADLADTSRRREVLGLGFAC
jgi:ABC-type branched-subunit amino acid transport system ATPase component